MDFKIKLDPDAFSSVVEHVFLPPKLPQKAASDLDERRCHTLLCSLAKDSAHNYSHNLPADQKILWNRISRMLKHMQRFATLPPTKEELRDAFGGMEVGDLLALHIRAQNAAVLVRRKEDETIFEVFEVTPLASAVTSTEGKLICSYPGPAVKVPADIFQQTSFLDALAAFLVQMDIDILDSVATTTKANSTVREIRESAHPRYISQLLIGILRGLGDIAEVERITKRIADDVLWEDALKPWRRSPLWMIIRVAIQTSVPPNDYKDFMVFHHAKLLRLSLDSPSIISLPHHLLFSMRAKTSRRLYKIRDSAAEFVICEVEEVVKRTEQELQKQWAAVQRAQAVSPRWEPASLDFDADTTLSLRNSRDYLLNAMKAASNPRPIPPFMPSESPRICKTADFHSLKGDGLAKAVESDAHVALADFEASIQVHLDQWVSAAIQGNRVTLACETLKSCLEQYLAAALKLYDGNAEDQSMMVLTVMELWVGLDMLAIAEHPLLAEYSPEIPSNFLEPLLLRRTVSIKRSIRLQQYLQQRHSAVRAQNPIFSDEARPASFSVAFFRQSLALQRKKGTIEAAAQKERDSKRAELSSKTLEYTSLKNRAAAMDHDYYPRWGMLCHANWCSKCTLERDANNMCIDVHEWPLPSDSDLAAMVVFELEIPFVFSAWRDSTYKILCEVGTSSSDGEDASPNVTLEDYLGLADWSGGVSKRITIGSTTKPFAKSHYKTVQRFPVTESDVCVQNGLTFRLFDGSRRVWAAQTFFDSNVASRCTPSLNPQGPYRTLQYAVEGTQHTTNQTIADQSECPIELSLHEHAAFADLRSGGRLQWLNIIRSLSSNSLSFSHEDVHTLVGQAACQIGPLTGTGAGAHHEWHAELSSGTFGHVLIDVLRDCLDSAGLNWLQGIMVRTIVFLASRLLASTDNSDVNQAAYKLLRRARGKTFQWVRNLAAKLQASTEETAVADYQRLVCDMAATCISSYDVDPLHLAGVLHTCEDVSIFVQCAVIVHDNMPPSLDTVGSDLRRLLSRHRRLLHSAEGALRVLVMADLAGMDDAIHSIWSGYSPGNFQWTSLPSANDRWLLCETSPSTGVEAQRVLYNSLDGRLLINGKPLGRLPRDIVAHSVYTRVFGNKILDIVPASKSGMEYATRDEVSGYKIFFGRDTGDELVIQATSGSDTYQIVPHTVFTHDLPTFFVEDYVHWLNLKTGEIEFRPLNSVWVSDLTCNWRLRFSKATPDMVHGQEGGSPDFLIDVHRPTASMLGDRLRPLESLNYLTITYTRTAESPLLSVNLPRLRLSFYLNGSLELESQNLPGMVVDEVQSSGTMFGLRNQLVLRANDPQRRTLPQSRRVLIPHGRILFSESVQENHAHVYINTGSETRVAVHEYKIDDDLGALVSTSNLSSKLYKCYLHAVTSHCLPDPLTGRTGTEEALHQLYAADVLSFQRLDLEDARLLDLIASLTPNRTYYPPHLQSMQTAEWHNLSPLAQHDSFHPAVSVILDYASALDAVFHKGDSNITFQRSERIASLRKRAERRNCVYYPANTSRTPKPDTGTDHHYSSRVVAGDDDVEKEYAVFVTSSRTRLPVSQTAYTSFSLVEAFKTWPWVGNDDPNQSLTMSYTSDWFRPYIPRFWIEIYNSCRNAVAESRFQHLFCLSAMTYGAPDLRQYVPVLLALETNSQLRLISPPRWPRYQLNDGTRPSREKTLEFITRSEQDLYNSPALTLPQRTDETDYSFQTRRHTFYRDELKSRANLLVDAVMREIPHAELELPSYKFQDYAPWFKLSECVPEIQQYFRSCARNHLFMEYAGQVEAALRLRSPTLPTALGGQYRYHPALVQPSSTAFATSIVTVRDLLGVRMPRRVDFTDLMYSDHHISPQRDGTPLDTRDLTQLISELHNDPDNAMRRQYANDLEQSRIDLEKQARNAPLNKIPPLDIVHKDRIGLIEDKDRIFARVRDNLSPITRIETLLSLSGLWPRLTPRSALDNLAFGQRRFLRDDWMELLTSYAKSFVDYRRSQRLFDLALDGKVEDFFKESASQLTEESQAQSSPDWLLIQIDANFSARPLQMKVARHMISPSPSQNTVLQLNMGEGKSHVIVPMVATALADGSKLLRVVVLKTLANQMFQLLVERVSGLANRRIFFLPFSRNIQLDRTQVSVIRQLIERCIWEGGVLLVQPEHILSFQLMGFDHLLSDSFSQRAIGQDLHDLQMMLDRVSRDILDESDEILHVRYQLVYTMGQQRPLEHHPNRWTIIQDLFSIAMKHASALCQASNDEIEFKASTGGRFPTIRILGEQAAQQIVERVAEDALSGSLSTLSFALFPPIIREAARRFITRRHVTDIDYNSVEACCRETILWPGLLLLRGLLVEETGILVYVLRKRRWRVDYGLDPTRTLLAVPYRAKKDMPSLRAEFGHPDVAIALTCLSYYYGGIAKHQVCQCFEMLYKLDNPGLEFEKWVRRGGDGIPQEFRQLSGINMKDHEQFTQVVTPLFSDNQAVMDFFLSNVVFPRDAKEFPHKLATSGWDLAKRKEQLTTGFSGTNDNRYLLPTSISQTDPVQQSSTSALVFNYLLQPENDHYACTQVGSAPASAKDFLKRLVQEKPEIRVLLDVGAQMLELQNQELVKEWLSLRRDILAAVFFSETDDLTVLTQDGTVEPFVSSPFRQRLDKCIVYLDDAHTRGTDLKLPRNTRAAVTLGPKVTTDRLKQGCMRMRQLGKGQSVMFFAPLEVDRQIREASPMQAGDRIKVIDILRWTIHETCADIQHHLPQWDMQGHDFARRQTAYAEYQNSQGDIEILRNGWIQPEARTLEEMYGPARSGSSQALDNIARIPALTERLKELGAQKMADARMEEEQEREVSHEIERERQVQRPPKARPAEHKLSAAIQNFIRTGQLPNTPSSPDIVPLFQPLHAVRTSNRQGAWSPRLLATTDFSITVTRHDRWALTDYLRPVNWILSNSEGSLVAISPFEANALLPELRASRAVHLHIYAPRVTQAAPSFSDLRFCCIPPLPPAWAPPPRLVRSQLNLWAGQLYIDDAATYTELCAFLGVELEAASEGASHRESDGFVLPGHRLPGRRVLESPFSESPLPALRELVGLRRKGMGFLGTHLGQVLHSRRLTEEDFHT
ncbi:hypothetical protein BV25DRAFT_1972593 [Artomyces pyxidatus]|uniref:Uncharacterized protein n=1 Tax=Artomyces pyxidatus TaxID=48021 RepID=A0ACB8TE76_9AGAM|nr:hypothetical protein BV25DRAFT_1972593 [Artomyces pyxidatus]